METLQLETIREKLSLRKAELEKFAEASKAGSQVVELDQTRVGRLSRMDAMQAQQMTLELVRRNQLELRQIEAALRRLENGDYGYCLRCGEEISAGRLNVNPAATCCVGCADL